MRAILTRARLVYQRLRPRRKTGRGAHIIFQLLKAPTTFRDVLTVLAVFIVFCFLDLPICVFTYLEHAEHISAAYGLILWTVGIVGKFPSTRASFLKTTQLLQHKAIPLYRKLQIPFRIPPHITRDICSYSATYHSCDKRIRAVTRRKA